MRLTVTTPTRIVVDERDVVAVRAEDETGSFGVWQRHADFLTALVPSVVSWRDAGGREGYCAVRGGLFSVSDGERIAITTREAVVGDDLAQLEAEVARRFAEAGELEAQARTDSARLHAAAIRRILGYLRPRPRDLSGGER
jgi:F-type H+-transporting ATPase subunit epsilon